MLQLERPYPRREEHAYLPHRERIEQRAQQLAKLRLVQGLAVRRHGVHAIGLLQLAAQRLRLPAVRRGRIHNHEERLPRCLHIPDGPCLCLAVVCARDVRDGPVRRDDEAHRAVLLHDLARAELGRLLHRKLRIGPRRCDHARLAVFRRADGPVHKIAHGIDEPHGQARRSVRRDLHGFLRHEFRLRRHDRPAGAALRQLVARPLALIEILDIGDHQFLHDALDQRGFSRAHRSHHADVDVSARSSGNVGVKIAHYHSLPHSLVIQAMRQGGQVCKSLSRSPLGLFDRLLPKFIKYGTNISSWACAGTARRACPRRSGTRSCSPRLSHKYA